MFQGTSFENEKSLPNLNVKGNEFVYYFEMMISSDVERFTQNFRTIPPFNCVVIILLTSILKIYTSTAKDGNMDRGLNGFSILITNSSGLRDVVYASVFFFSVVFR